MNSFVLKGQICTSGTMDRIEITENGFLVVEDGLVRGVFSALPSRFSALPLRDCGDCLILPGMTDLHIHAPQFAFRGLGMDMELLEWLNTYTFKTEARFSDVLCSPSLSITVFPPTSRRLPSQVWRAKV